MKCIEDEIPFDVPDNWEWVRLGAICPYGDNKSIPSDSINESSWILDLEDIEKDTGLIKHYTTKTERNSVSNKYAFTTGQLLYSKLRPYLNKVVIATKNGYCTTEILPLIFYGNITAKYMQIFMMSPTFLAYANMISYGVKMPRLGTSDGKNALIAIPPINEQLRIRKEFDIIIPLLRKIEKHSDTLHSNILATKSKILDLAIRGKLVPQDPNDEPASVLLEHIQAEKEELIKQGKIKRDKKESVIFKGDDNSYYQDLPKNWSICSLGDVSEVVTGGTPSKSNKDFYNGSFPFFKPADLEQGVNTITPSEYLSDEGKNVSRIIPEQSTLICCIGTIGKSGFVRCECATNQQINAVIPYIEPKYIYYFCNSRFFINELQRNATATTVAIINKSKTAEIPFLLPPITEQKRIVEAIEKIFATLDDIANQVE